jgi:DeoR/GlpR family transcriptional regulator of sugar metabolism
VDARTRLSELVDVLRSDGRIDVADAAIRFGTAEMTIRRDLDVLVERGLARRVRGGALSLLMAGEELPFAMRELESVAAKRRIAAAVSGLLLDGEAVALDSGTTAVEVARALHGKRLTVIPMSLHVATACAGFGGIRLIVPGGEVRPGELAMVGPLTAGALASLRVDTAVIGSCGVSPDGHVLAHDLGDAAVKQALLGSARRSILTVDGAKFGRPALAVVAALSTFDVVITDETAPDDAVERLRSAGVEVHRV